MIAWSPGEDTQPTSEEGKQGQFQGLFSEPESDPLRKLIQSAKLLFLMFLSQLSQEALPLMANTNL